MSASRETFQERFARTDQLVKIGEAVLYDNKFYYVANIGHSFVLLNGVPSGGQTLDIDYFYENALVATEEEQQIYGERLKEDSLRSERIMRTLRICS